MKTTLVTALLMGAASMALAQTTPVGLWKTIDDKTKKERSLVRIVDTGGTLAGRIEKRLDPDAKPDDRCTKCSDDRKDQPLQGLEIVRGVKADGEAWSGGSIPGRVPSGSTRRRTANWATSAGTWSPSTSRAAITTPCAAPDPTWPGSGGRWIAGGRWAANVRCGWCCRPSPGTD